MRRAAGAWELCGGDCVKELAACITNHPYASMPAVIGMQVLFSVVSNDTHGAAARARLAQEAASRPALAPALAAAVAHRCRGGRIQAPGGSALTHKDTAQQQQVHSALGLLHTIIEGAASAREHAWLEALASAPGVAAALEAALRAGAAPGGAGAGDAAYLGILLSGQWARCIAWHASRTARLLRRASWSRTAAASCLRCGPRSRP